MGGSEAEACLVPGGNSSEVNPCRRSGSLNMRVGRCKQSTLCDLVSLLRIQNLNAPSILSLQ